MDELPCSTQEITFQGFKVSACKLKNSKENNKNNYHFNNLHFKRHDNRGVGTRNYITIIGLTSRVSGFVKNLENRINKVLL